VEVALEAFGPGRLLFGSDWPVCLLAASWDRWAAAIAELIAALSPDEADALLTTTATSTYRLDGPAELDFAQNEEDQA